MACEPLGRTIMVCPECGAKTYTASAGLEICPQCGYGSPSVVKKREDESDRQQEHEDAMTDMKPYFYGPHDTMGFIQIVNIGWLDARHPFPTAEHSPELLNRIKQRLSEIKEVNVTYSRHACEFCGYDKESSWEYHFYNPGTGLGYAAPSMFYHYMAVHNYAPPQEFIQAIFNNKILSDYLAILAVQSFSSS
jgi:ribosomal protein L37E